MAPANQMDQRQKIIRHKDMGKAFAIHLFKWDRQGSPGFIRRRIG